METASSWHSGQTSALYSLVSTEKVHTEQHREELLAEIEGEIADLTADNFVKTETFSTDEIESLNDLRLFVKAFDIDQPILPTEDDIDEMMQCGHDDAYGIVDAYFPE